MDWQFVEFYELRISASDLKKLPKYHATFVVMSGFAINEITVLLRMHLLSANAQKRVSKSKPVTKIAAANLLVLDRLLSSKLVEYIKFVESYHNQMEQAKVDSVRWKHGKKTISELEVTDGMDIARWIRDRVTFHFDKKIVRDIIDEAPDSASYSIYLSSAQGNTWDLLGEEVLVGGKFWPHGKNFEGNFEVWRTWIVDAARTLIELHNTHLKLIIEEYFGNVVAIERREIVEDELVADPSVTAIPLFWKT
jgi:hypothetical protein